MTWLPKDADLKQIRAAFAADRFATEVCGATIVDAGYQRAVCQLELGEKHLNAQGNVMGGAIFTLADFCLAVISNVGEQPTMLVSSNIEYLLAPKGRLLTATGSVLRSGRSLGFYNIDIHDDTGNHVARLSATCYRKPG
jgi:acyl-CoA thioesterase